MKYRQPIADIIRLVLIEYGMNQVELAAAIGSTRFTINQLANGQRNLTAGPMRRRASLRSTDVCNPRKKSGGRFVNLPRRSAISRIDKIQPGIPR
jgi:hypothetical protein